MELLLLGKCVSMVYLHVQTIILSMLVQQLAYLQISVIQQIVLGLLFVRLSHSHVVVVDEVGEEVVVDDFVVMEYSKWVKSVML